MLSSKVCEQIQLWHVCWENVANREDLKKNDTEKNDQFQFIINIHLQNRIFTEFQL